MEGLMLLFGRISGGGGLLLSIVSAVARLKGDFFLAGFQVGTLLQGGIALMTFGCLCFLAVLTNNSGKRL